MSIAKLAWLTSPASGRYILNFQIFGSEDVLVIEVGPDHMRNILSDGVPLMLRQSFHRVPVTTNTESADGHASAGSQRTA
jgi:hypothetical protein